MEARFLEKKTHSVTSDWHVILARGVAVRHGKKNCLIRVTSQNTGADPEILKGGVHKILESRITLSVL